ncbi:MAG TPA: efflux RND transporter periplasmic adaptor subunit [Gammaproteobacteria bacterium]|nr:efflux RND transporter periplasmic adaptor subunit [Gammaproteobacteria bacterium]
MRRHPRPRAARRAGTCAGLGLLLACSAAFGSPGLATATARTVRPHYTAYGRVQPVSLTRLRAGHAGVVTGLAVRPGQHLEAGQVLGHLRGPAVTAAVAQRRSAVSSARAALSAARHELSSERQKRASHLSTRQAVYRARAALARAKGGLAAARAELRAVRRETTLRAPAAGTVSSLSAGDGERVDGGETVLTVLPAHGLWLQATYYGSNAGAVHSGMRGHFVPADGSAAIAVRVVGIVPAVRADGGLPVDLEPAAGAGTWHSGEAGTVVLTGPARKAVMIPTRALVLDQGQWWVLVHAAGGDRRRQVTPGSARGDETVIEKGLSPGDKVVVRDADLRFHRAVSRHYAPPD